MQHRPTIRIQYQIDQLERILINPNYKGNKFALEGKIKKLKKELVESKNFEYLAR